MAKHTRTRSEDTVILPEAFYFDHMERDLPTPKKISSRGKRIVVRKDDPALLELLSDARHYATGGVDQVSHGLIKSAKATVQAIEKSGIEVVV